MGQDVSYNHVKYGDPRSNFSREIAPEAVRDGIFDGFCRDNFWPEVVSDVISGMVNQDVGMDVCANFGDSRLKPSEASFSAIFERR